MSTVYRTVDTRTLKGLKEAERLKANGWTIGSVGLYTIEFYRKSKPRKVGKKATKASKKGSRKA